MEDNDKEIINRVAASSLVTLDLEDYYVAGERAVIDIAGQLFEGLVLRERDFRSYIRSTDWSRYQDCFVAITCSQDAIIPTWAYMLLVSAVQPYARKVVFGTLDDLETRIFLDEFSKIDWNKFQNAKVVIKGCSKVNVPAAVYVEATNLLMPRASSIMFGEACSTVPVHKKSKK